MTLSNASLAPPLITGATTCPECQATTLSSSSDQEEHSPPSDGNRPSDFQPLGDTSLPSLFGPDFAPRQGYDHPIQKTPQHLHVSLTSPPKMGQPVAFPAERGNSIQGTSMLQNPTRSEIATMLGNIQGNGARSSSARMGFIPIQSDDEDSVARGLTGNDDSSQEGTARASLSGLLLPKLDN